jgi:probable HAF family extracellular repeat protein
MKVLLNALTLCAAGALLSPQAMAELPRYRVNDLGTLGGNETIVRDINDAGQITGNSDTASDPPHAFLYWKGQMYDIGPPGELSIGYAINDAGEIAGEMSVGSGPMRAFKYSQGVVQNLGSLPGGRHSAGEVINNLGQVAGSAYATPDEYHPVLFFGGQVQDLGTPGVSGSAVAINDSGDILISNFRGTDAVFLHRNGQTIDVVPGFPTFVFGPHNLTPPDRLPAPSA